MKFLERLTLDTGKLADGEVPYLLLRVDTLVGLFQRLDTDARANALKAFADSVFEHGGHSIARYQRETGAQPHELIALLSSTAPQLGWGQWAIDIVEADSRYELRVRNSPFCGLAQSGPACAPVAGMFRALLSRCTDTEMSVEETQCCSDGAEQCLFTATRRQGQSD